jgi:ABC-type multidrug transport system permease subunit
VFFVIPYFFIVGFDKGDVAKKFFWYWLFQGLYMTTSVFHGHMLASVLPNPTIANGRRI